MIQHTPAEKHAISVAKSTWKLRMKSVYPNFKPRQWARDSYRLAHPQSVLLKLE